MKKLFLFASILLIAFNLKAQELSFEQTVKYIKDKIESNEICCSVGSFCKEVRQVSIQNNGNVIIKTQADDEIKFNLFKLSKNKDGFSLREDGIGVLKDNVNYYTMIQTTNSLDAERLYKAFLHLRSLCTKEKDPFDN